MTFISFRSKNIITWNLFNCVFRYVGNTGVPIPTHYFVVLTSCKNQSHTPDACPGGLDVLPFIIPHRPTNMESCPVSMLAESSGPEKNDLLQAFIKMALTATYFFSCFMGRVVLNYLIFTLFLRLLIFM